MRPKVNTNPVAQQYAGSNERIIEYSHKGVGGLISFREHADGHLMVQLYRHDPQVEVAVEDVTGGEPPINWDVTYQVRSLIKGGDAGSFVAEGAVTVLARSKTEAGRKAVTFAHDNDPYCDDRIEPVVKIIDVRPEG